MIIKETVAGYEVSVEIDEKTGNVIVSGAPSVMVHFIHHFDREGTYLPGRHPSGDLSKNRHLSFRCEQEEKAVRARAFAGPNGCWKQNAMPTLEMTSSFDARGFLVLDATAGCEGEQFRLLAAGQLK